MPENLALFPLNTVLFPGGPLPLRIFETRYLDMLSRCFKNDQGFGVCLIEQGSETGPARSYTVGTLARVRDWSNGPDGLLHILAVGERRFRVFAHAHTARRPASGRSGMAAGGSTHAAPGIRQGAGRITAPAVGEFAGALRGDHTGF